MALRGRRGDVDDLTSKIKAFVEQQEKEDLERGYTISFDFPQKFANLLIGKRGENINKLREEFDVDIKVDNGTVEIKGPKAKADAAKHRIVTLGRRWEDERTYVLKIPPKYHRDLIGQRGSQVNRLQERYNVRVQFPRAAAGSPNDDQSVADSASEVGGRGGRQAPDEVIVKGPSKGADAARDEILSLLQWIVDHSHSAVVSVSQNQIPSLIGQRGREMDKLRADTGAQIEVPSASKESGEGAGRVEIKIRGTKEQVEEARSILERRAQEFDSIVSRTIEVDKKHHKPLIGAGGAQIRKIIMEAGGPSDSTAARMVKFPRADSDDRTIRLEGPGPVVEKIIGAIEAFVQEREDQVTETISVPPAQHRLLIGRGGDTRRALESRFNVAIDVPKQGSGQSNVKIRGPSKGVADARAHIEKLLQEHQAETVAVPRRLHHVVADNGAFFRRLRNDYQVTVDHAGQQPPAKPAAESARDGPNGVSSLPLITDDPSQTAHSWKVVAPVEVDSSDDSTIPWVLSGPSAESIQRAKNALEQALASATSRQGEATGYLVLADPKTHRFVIGPGGSQINTIRQQTGCRITVPNHRGGRGGGSSNEAIEIRGRREALEQAREMILDAVRAGVAGSGR